MPPQPLSHFKKAQDVKFIAKSLDLRPGLAIKIMAVINTWSHIDHLLTVVVANVLKSDFKIVADMLGAMTGAEARNAAMTAAINTGLPEDAELFAAIRKAIKPSRNKRNDFAHHLWGVCEQLPDALLLVDPRKLTVRYAEYLEAKNAGEVSEYVSMLADHSEIMVYRDIDLTSEVEAARTALSFVGRFYAISYGGVTDSMRTKLLSEPLIQQALQPKSNGNDP